MSRLWRCEARPVVGTAGGPQRDEDSGVTTVRKTNRTPAGARALPNPSLGARSGRLADLEHLGAAHRARALRRRLPVLHRDGPRILHLALRPALEAVRLHMGYLLPDPRG